MKKKSIHVLQRKALQRNIEISEAHEKAKKIGKIHEMKFQCTGYLGNEEKNSDLLSVAWIWRNGDH